MTGDHDDADAGRTDHRFVPTQRMRVPAKNPQIERKATLRRAETAVTPPKASGAGRPDFGGSLYDRLEQTDDPEDLTAALAQLEEALGADAGSSVAARPAPERRRPPPPDARRPMNPVALTVPPPQNPAIAEETVPARPRPPRAEAGPSVTLEPSRNEASTGRSRTEVTVGGRPPPLSAPARARAAQPGLLDDDETVVAAARAPTAPAKPRRTRCSDDPPSTDPVPRARWVGGGTKAAAAELRRQQILRDAELPDLRSPALRLYVGAVSPDRLHRLDAIISDAHDDHELGRLMSLAEPLVALLEDRAFGELPVQERAALLTTVADHDDDLATVKVAHTLARSGVLPRLSAEGRAQVHAIFRRLDTDDRVRLARLAARRSHTGSALLQVDAHGVSIVDHLSTLFDGGQVDEWWHTQGLRPKVVASLILGTLAQPSRLSPEEGADGVMATLEFCLADRFPAELTRLWRCLLSGNVPMQGDVEIDAEALRGRLGRPTPIRDLLALLPDKLAGRASFVATPGPGLDAEVLTAALKSLFGASYVAVAGAAAAERRLRGIDVDGRYPAFISMIGEREERLFVFDRFDDERVYVRSPHGRSAKRVGDERIDPRRVVVEPECGIDSIDLRAFQASAGLALVPFDGSD